ncbi:MAG: undecaprenyldiphospho-muramoylpentapeptide beta-N-acetylglucosaminyltransferase [Bacteroidetes bacterium]|nr:undecaprenyldiphospho-muramoylpentapeptide beta-N-acetylglucosaminyltransferase [Bacteroidota bacterium]
MQRPSLRVIISGGGTGGHIFPAVAIANALKKMNPATEILFVGANGRMEMEKVPAAGYKIVGLNISGIQRKLSLQNLMLPIKILQSVLKARMIVKEFKPDVAVGVGGYASGPLLFAATGMNVPALIQEQNSFAGITNKLLSKRVKRICVAYDGMENYFPADKIKITGNPVRENMVDIKGKREEALRFFRLSSDKKTVLLIGGSLGARTLNHSIAEGIQKLADKNIQLIWQTGKAFYPKAQELTSQYSANGISAYDFIQRMDLAFAAADVVISRAGASSVSELALVAKPAILVPSPNVAEDHQTKNAMSLVKKDAAILISDAEASAKLITQAIELINDQSAQNKLQQNISKLALANSADVIAEEVYSISGK